MSFDIKYDRDGNPIKDKIIAQNLEVAAEVPEQIRSGFAKSAPDRDELPHIQQESSSSEDYPIERAISNVESDSAVEVEEVATATETPKERNMRILREAKESADRERQRAMQERDEAIKRAEDLERRYKKSSQVQVDDESDDFNIGEDDLAEGKHLKKVYKEVKDLKKQVEYYKQNAQTQTIESRIRSEFPDFANVVTPDNITLLKHIKPRQAALLDQSTDLYETAATAYEMIKEYVIPPEDKYVQQKQVAQRNAAKPKPVASLSPQSGDSPLSKANAFANGFTPELAAQLRKEMEEIRKAN
jgi:hypothetical protein